MSWPFCVIGNFNAKTIKLQAHFAQSINSKLLFWLHFYQRCRPAHPTPIIVCHTHSLKVASNGVSNRIFRTLPRVHVYFLWCDVLCCAVLCCAVMFCFISLWRWPLFRVWSRGQSHLLCGMYLECITWLRFLDNDTLRLLACSFSQGTVNNCLAGLYCAAAGVIPTAQPPLTTPVMHVSHSHLFWQ
jgi:hypothetical protein